MSPIGSRFDSRRILASLATASVLFIGGTSIAGCQSGAAAQPADPQGFAQVTTGPASPLTDPAPTRESTPLATTSPAVATPEPAAPEPVAAPPASPITSSPAHQPRIAAVAPPAALSSLASGACDADYYRNSDGNCIHRPQHTSSAPAGATARCSDGTYSFSQHRQGTCSGHGGVGQWL